MNVYMKVENVYKDYGKFKELYHEEVTSAIGLTRFGLTVLR